MSAANPTLSNTTQELGNLKLFGRKYRLRVIVPNEGSSSGTVIDIGDSSFEPEALRVTFDVRTVFFQAAWFAEINIYNLDLTTSTALVGGLPEDRSVDVTQSLKQGMTCILEAGYQNGNYGVIWNGPVFQVLFVRENVTDFKITLHCLLWLDFANRNPVIGTLSAGPTGLNQTTIIQKLVASAFGVAAPPPNISSDLKPNSLSRAKVIFGSAADYFDQLADDNNMQWFVDSRGFNFGRIPSKAEEIPTTEQAKVFTPETGLIGTPEQTQYGVNFRVLLDPTVRVQMPAMTVSIDNSQIVQLKRSLGEYPSLLDQNGVYIVQGARYVGDTRGNAWYTEVSGYLSGDRKLALLNRP